MSGVDQFQRTGRINQCMEVKMAQVRCKGCGWQGELDDLVVKYHLNLEEPGDIIPEGVCPECGNPNWEDMEDEYAVV